MKKLALTNTKFATELQQYQSWLKTLEYSPTTVYNSPNYLKEFLCFLEQENCNEFSKINQENINQYFEYLQARANQTQGGGLSKSSINKHIENIRRFKKFLVKTQQIHLPINLPTYVKNTATKKPLTKEQIKQLFKACSKDILGLRDAAMLGIYYGCGLRKKEGLTLNVEDIDLSRRLLHVRKSKTHRERFVPISKNTVKIIESYQYNSREYLLSKNNTENAFLISSKGNRLNSGSAPACLKKIARETKGIKEEQVSLHILRHSIGTHLLQAGMNLENIALFLGHTSLDSTQIYTHLAHETHH